ncbi:hypothetical protein [Marinobacter sp. 2_MG-2023]|uniref:hypothetical protein n=1 Tax=Marinobacter sp. 2_MG-2023 TaxID=3062679 RepID=UPI0026E17B1C|nr:hypothetical protein [Marinobacter sp. 2_MG-2023]MDO6442520.1 hypothetical protein [Marinobacter sp. 2_MG-2023]
MTSLKMQMGSFLLLTTFLTAPLGAEVIFAESFDGQPDWTSGLRENDKGELSMGGSASGGWEVDIVQKAGVHNIPNGWSYVRQTPSWAPSLGDLDKHENIEISSLSTLENPNRARGGTGKSFVTWRDSDISKGENSFGSDGILMKYFSQGFDQLYVEFWINFSNTMIDTYYNPDYKLDTIGLSKVFRIYHWTGDGNVFDYYSDKNPNFIWGFEGRPTSQSGYGFRNTLSALTRRDDKYGNDPKQSRFIDYNGEPSNKLPSSYHPKALASYGDAQLVDRSASGFITAENGAVDIDQVFGDETHWTKMAFFVRMNSSPGAYDGQLVQWVDDKKIVEINTVQWVAATRNMVQWNSFAIGGNDNFNKYPDELKHEEWYAIDDILVSTEIPDYLTVDLNEMAPPTPPLKINVD